MVIQQDMFIHTDIITMGIMFLQGMDTQKKGKVITPMMKTRGFKIELKLN